jgi:hypothetical protein
MKNRREQRMTFANLLFNHNDYSTFYRHSSNYYTKSYQYFLNYFMIPIMPKWLKSAESKHIFQLTNLSHDIPNHNLQTTPWTSCIRTSITCCVPVSKLPPENNRPEMSMSPSSIFPSRLSRYICTHRYCRLMDAVCTDAPVHFYFWGEFLVGAHQCWASLCVICL